MGDETIVRASRYFERGPSGVPGSPPSPAVAQPAIDDPTNPSELFDPDELFYPQAVRQWVSEHRPDVLDEIDDCLQNDALRMLLSVGFASGVKWAKRKASEVK